MTSDPTISLIDSIAHAVCPIVKPWMDSGDTPRHPCRKCTDTVYHGEKSYPCCLAVCRDIAKAAIAAMGKASKEGLVRENDHAVASFPATHTLECAIDYPDKGCTCGAENSSEISVKNEVWENGVDCLIAQEAQALSLIPHYPPGSQLALGLSTKIEAAMWRVIEAIYPRPSAPMPVSVSLDTMTQVACSQYTLTDQVCGGAMKASVQAVLDAAGVKYVD